jgi:hypothetical protein
LGKLRKKQEEKLQTRYVEGTRGQRKRNREGRKTIKEVCTSQKTESTNPVL